MEFYKEYPIRCKTCGEQLACYAEEYEQLLESGYSIEDALNELGITDYCSRIGMMNPPIVTFNMENREVIEGFKNVDAADEDTSQKESTSHPVFTACIGPGSVIQTAAPATTGLLEPRKLARTPAQTIQPAQPTRTLPQGMKTIAIAQPKIQPKSPGIPLPVTTVKPLVKEIKPDEKEPQGVGIPINIPEGMETGKFTTPVAVGIPTINPDNTFAKDNIYVGAGKYTTVLNGRTYLAQ